MTFEEWYAQTMAPWRKRGGQRLGQWLYNHAPSHIAKFATTKPNLDPFHLPDNHPDTDQVIKNFLTFAELVWDTVDQEEMGEAQKLVLSEPGAVVR